MTCDDCHEPADELHSVSGERLCPQCTERAVERYHERLRREGRWDELGEILDREGVIESSQV